MEKKSHLNITLDAKVVQWIDVLRGQYPRSTFINKVLFKFCEETQGLFNWEEESRLAGQDLHRGRVRKFHDPEKAIRWLKS